MNNDMIKNMPKTRAYIKSCPLERRGHHSFAVDWLAGNALYRPMDNWNRMDSEALEYLKQLDLEIDRS